MKKNLISLAVILLCTAAGAQTITLDKYETVYKDDNVTFRKLDDNTWLGSGNLMSSESLYLIAGKKRAILIDAGTTIPGLDKIASDIARKPVTLVLTHVHPDHAGAVGCFDEVWISPADTVNIPAFMNDYTGKVRFLKNGQKFRLGGRVLQAYFTPGHTPGSVTFLEKGTDTGYCGDAFGTGNDGNTGGILVFTDMETIIKTCQDSYEYFSRKGYRKLYCGHFYGDNFVTMARLKRVEAEATDILNGKLTGSPIDGYFGLNRRAESNGFSVRYIDRGN